MHRNLKSDNILVNFDPECQNFENPNFKCVISDFYLGRHNLKPLEYGKFTQEDPKERERSGREARRLWYRAPELLFRP